MQNGLPAKITAKWLRAEVILGLAMRLMCFALLQGTPGIVAPSIHDAAVNAATMWNQVQQGIVRIETRAIQVYDNIRFAYQVEERLRELQREPGPADATMKPIGHLDACYRSRHYNAAVPTRVCSSTSVHNLTVL